MSNRVAGLAGHIAPVAMISEIIGIHYLVNSRAGVRVPADTLDPAGWGTTGGPGDRPGRYVPVPAARPAARDDDAGRRRVRAGPVTLFGQDFLGFDQGDEVAVWPAAGVRPAGSWLRLPSPTGSPPPSQSLRRRPGWAPGLTFARFRGTSTRREPGMAMLSAAATG